MAGLFDRLNSTSDMVAAPPKPALPPQRGWTFRKIREPYGAPDKRGKHGYEKFHKEALKHGEDAWRTFFELLLKTDATRFAGIIEIGMAWNKLSPLDQGDYEEAIGLRG